MTGWLRRPSVWVFAVLLASYASFWHARDWNTASRLMLTYSLVDRGTVRLDGLDKQTGDIAFFEGHYYTDKAPGYSFLGVAPYAVCRLAGLKPHPLDREGFAHWPADYVVTLCVSGLATAALGALLTSAASGLFQLGPRRSALIGLAFGLATPAYAYATLAYGHNITGLALFASFLWIVAGPSGWRRSLAAGASAAFAVVVEVQSAPVAVVLGTALLVRCLSRGRRWTDLIAFGLGALAPALLLAAYNLTAFGKVWDMGYFHHATPRFADVHSAANPLGLSRPDWSKCYELLIGRYRGLLFHAPVLWLTVPGWVVLGMRRQWGLLLVSLASCLAVFLVNLSYPEWTGGWSTGPRLLVPLLPFAILPVGAFLALDRRGITFAALALTLVGAVLMLMDVGVGGRLPDSLGPVRLNDPFVNVVWPLWRGDPVPRWWIGERFTRTVVSVLAPEWARSLPPELTWCGFAPLVAAQLVLVAAMVVFLRPARRQSASSSSTKAPGISPGRAG